MRGGRVSEAVSLRQELSVDRCDKAGAARARADPQQTGNVDDSWVAWARALCGVRQGERAVQFWDAVSSARTWLTRYGTITYGMIQRRMSDVRSSGSKNCGNQSGLVLWGGRVGYRTEHKGAVIDRNRGKKSAEPQATCANPCAAWRLPHCNQRLATK